MLDTLRNASVNTAMVVAILTSLVLLAPCDASAQNWVWSREVLDTSGSVMSLAVHREGNVRLRYGAEKGLTYAFRAVGPSRWLIMLPGGGVSYTNLKVDQSGNP